MSEEKTVIDSLKEKVSVYQETVEELEKAQKAVDQYQAYQNSIKELAEIVLSQEDTEAIRRVRSLFIEADTLTVIAARRADLIQRALASQILDIINTVALLT